MRFRAGYLFWIIGLSALIYLYLKLNVTSGHASRDAAVEAGRSLQVRDISYSNLDFLQNGKLAKENSEFEVFVDEKKSEISEEIRHVAFLKVHKTASSTAQNVFLRFGDSRKLNFVLPHTKGESGWLNVISYNHSITSTNIVPAPKGEHFDILCCHVLYNKEQFKKVLPVDTAYIGIVREPVSRFQSAVKYFSPRFILKIPGPHPLSVYVRHPTKYDHDDPRHSQMNNRMALEFGFPHELFPGKSLNRSTAEINKYLEKLDKEFKFIIISERFDESMVMLRRILNWTMKDVLYVDKNRGMAQPNTKKLLQESDMAPLREFLYLDDALYNWAVHRFTKQIAAEGESFTKEVEFFRKVREKVKEFCKSQQMAMTVEQTTWNKEFSVVRSDCTDFNKHEKEMIQKQRMRMYGTLDN